MTVLAASKNIKHSSFMVVTHGTGKDRKYLVGKRSKSANNPNQWGFFGGTNDPGETPHEAGKREFFEETGHQLETTGKHLGTHKTKIKHTHYFLHNTKTQMVPKLDKSETSKHKWASRAELKKMNLHASVTTYFRKIRPKNVAKRKALNKLHQNIVRARAEDWQEKQHPRRFDGEFTFKNHPELSGKKWEHYTDHDELRINPKQFHQDPAGIYFFPHDFTKHGYWAEKKHKFTVKIDPNATVLHLGKITPKQLKEITDHVGITKELDDYVAEYPRLQESFKRKVDAAWELMQRKFFLEHGRKAGLWNKKLQQLGYDAIYDDTKSIHSKEDQLLVLNKKIIKNVTRETSKKSAFKAVSKVYQDLLDKFGKLGHVETEPPKIKSYYGQKTLEAYINISTNEDAYPNNPGDGSHWYKKSVSFKIKFDPKEVGRKSVHVGMTTNPSLNYGAGINYNISNAKYDHDEGIEHLTKDVAKIFGAKVTAALLTEMPYGHWIKPDGSKFDVKDEHHPHVLSHIKRNNLTEDYKEFKKHNATEEWSHPATHYAVNKLGWVRLAHEHNSRDNNTSLNTQFKPNSLTKPQAKHLLHRAAEIKYGDHFMDVGNKSHHFTGPKAKEQFKKTIYDNLDRASVTAATYNSIWITDTGNILNSDEEHETAARNYIKKGLLALTTGKMSGVVTAFAKGWIRTIAAGDLEPEFAIEFAQDEVTKSALTAAMKMAKEGDYYKYYITIVKLTDISTKTVKSVNFDKIGSFNLELRKLQTFKTTASNRSEIESESQHHGISYDQKHGLGNVPFNQEVTHRGFGVMMKPSQFLKLAAPKHYEDEKNAKHIETAIKNNKPIGSPFLDVRFDMKHKKPAQVVSHEGRSRMRAIAKVHGDVPVLVHIFGADGKRASSITEHHIKAFQQTAKPQDKTRAINGPHFGNLVHHKGEWKDVSNMVHKTEAATKYEPNLDHVDIKETTVYGQKFGKLAKEVHLKSGRHIGTLHPESADQDKWYYFINKDKQARMHRCDNLHSGIIHMLQKAKPQKHEITANAFGYKDMKYNTAKREQAAKEGKALPDGSFPIKDATDLKSAVRNWGRAANPAKAKRWIIKRARELKLVNELPEKWHVTAQTLERQELINAHVKDLLSEDGDSFKVESFGLLKPATQLFHAVRANAHRRAYIKAKLGMRKWKKTGLTTANQKANYNKHRDDYHMHRHLYNQHGAKLLKSMNGNKSAPATKTEPKLDSTPTRKEPTLKPATTPKKDDTNGIYNQKSFKKSPDSDTAYHDLKKQSFIQQEEPKAAEPKKQKQASAAKFVRKMGKKLDKTDLSETAKETAKHHLYQIHDLNKADGKDKHIEIAKHAKALAKIGAGHLVGKAVKMSHPANPRPESEYTRSTVKSVPTPKAPENKTDNAYEFMNKNRKPAEPTATKPKAIKKTPKPANENNKDVNSAEQRINHHTNELKQHIKLHTQTTKKLNAVNEALKQPGLEKDVKNVLAKKKTQHKNMLSTINSGIKHHTNELKNLGVAKPPAIKKPLPKLNVPSPNVAAPKVAKPKNIKPAITPQPVAPDVAAPKRGKIKSG